ncbi:lysozyme inhibitor LprI family protein [Roseovarius pacificus]|uniref:hypothetical protein n=1 Tax=Roseovarius pacificus TaxID=337701 RepID=UPI00403A1EE0
MSGIRVFGAALAACLIWETATAQAQSEAVPVPAVQDVPEAGWYFSGGPNGPMAAFRDGETRELTLSCAESSGSSSVSLRMDVSDAIWDVVPGDYYAISLKNVDRIKLPFDRGWHERISTVHLPRAPIRGLESPPEDASIDVTTDGAKVIRSIPVSNLSRPLREIMSHCVRGIAGLDEPSYACQGSFRGVVESEICRNPEVARFDRRVADSYHVVTAEMTPKEQAAAWERHREWQDRRSECQKDMTCVMAEAQAYLASLGAPEPASEAPPTEAVAALAADPAAAAAEVESHGFSGTLMHVAGNTAYYDVTTDQRSPGHVLAVHDVDATTLLPDNRESDIAAFTEIAKKREWTRGTRIYHVRLGHPIPENIWRIVEDNVEARRPRPIDPITFALTYLGPKASWQQIANKAQEHINARMTPDEQAAYRLAERQRRLAEGREREENRASEVYERGLIYKQPGFYAQFQNPRATRAMFEGNRLQRDAPILRDYVAGFHIGLEQRCRAFLPDDAVPFSDTTVTVVRNILGVEYSRSSETSTLMLLPEFAEYYAWTREPRQAAGNATGLMVTAQDLAAGRISLGQAAAIGAGAAADAARLVTIGRCDGPLMQQLREVLLASVEGRPPEALPQGVFEAESDPPPGPGVYQRLEDACYAANLYERDSLARCHCTASGFRDRLPEADLRSAMNDWYTFRERLVPGASGERSPAGSIWNECRLRHLR